MAAVQLQNALVDNIGVEPEENWDDDFEFQGDPASHSGSRNSRKKMGPISPAPKLSVGSRAETEDWDVEQDVRGTGGLSQASVHLTTSTSTLKAPTLSPMSALRNSPIGETENWDDDFEDARNSPQKTTSTFPPARSSSLMHASSSSPGSNRQTVGHIDEPVESWDDDLELNDAEFGLAEHEEEDRTVTARSRRAALSRATRKPSTPPPPTPKLPLVLSENGVFLAPDQPFPQAHSPHSPTSSVFSVPATVRTTGSSAPLFASSSRAYPSASARVFSLLPPSPQVHKERERRRLRKRSRPGEREDRERRREREGVFELVEVVEGRTSLGGTGRMWQDEQYGRGYGRGSMDSERESEIEEEEEGRESANGRANSDLHALSRRQDANSTLTRPSTAPTSSITGLPSQLQSVPATPTKHTLLSRIGSVKRWAGAEVRRRRGMSTGPEDVAGVSRYIDGSHDTSDTHRTPRPHSSMSSFTNHDSGSSYSNQRSPFQHNHHRYSAAQSRSPSNPASPSKSPQSNAVANAAAAGDRGSWFFRASSRASNTTSPTGPPRRAFRSTSRSNPADGASPDTTGSPHTDASPSPRTRRKLSRSGSGRRRPLADRSADPPRTPRCAGDRDASGSATPSSQWNGVGVGRRPSSRTTGIEGRKGVRASLDFSASRTSLGMTMSILEAQEKERERTAYTPSPSLEPGVVGRGRGYSVGENDREGGMGNEGRTPAKLIKRKSLGLVQLRRATVGAGYKKEDVAVDAVDVNGIGKDPTEDDREGDGKHARYGGLGIGRALGLGRGTDGGEDERHGKEKEGWMEERKRRKSFSRFLKDRDKERDRDMGREAVSPTLPETPSKDKDKAGSRGFMGSVRRISLVGKHKRTKSGSGLALGSVPPSPSSPFFSRHASSGAAAPSRGVPPLPYALPLLPGSSSSQLSLRLPSSSTSHLPLPPHPLAPRGIRVASTASSQSQGSSVLPASSSGVSTSASSSRHPSTNYSQASASQTQKTPTQPPQQQPAIVRRPSSRRSRISEEGSRPSLGSSRQSIDFDARIRRSIDREIHDKGTDAQVLRHSQPKASSNVPPTPEFPLHPMPLLPPIELQPPSPPHTISPATASIDKKLVTQETQVHPMSARPLGAALNTFDSLSPTNSSSSLFFTPTSSPHPPASPNKLTVSQSPGKSPGSQQSASLGRVTAANAVAATEGSSGQSGAAVPRRNSLGDLKIPARISQAQVGIKRDLGLVREFANSVDQLKELQQVYNGLVAQVQSIFESHIQQHAQQIPSPPPRTTSPSFFANLTQARPKSRARSNTNPTPSQISASNSPSLQDVTTAQMAYKDMASTFYTINSKYRISWECAELLIELGGGTPNANANATRPPPSSASAPLMHQAQAAAFDNVGKKKSRERAVTLAGDHSKPYPTASTTLVGSASLPTSPPHLDASSPPPASPPSMSWRASTGRHDLSQRQLSLLREMLNNTNATSVADQSHLSIPEESFPSLHSLRAVNKDWRWGDARNSTITLPSEGSGATHHDHHVSTKKRKAGKLGMTGIRDMLRALKRSHTESEAAISPSSPPSTANGPMTKVLHSTASLSTQSSKGSKNHRHAHPRLPSNRRRAKVSTGPETLRASQDIDREIMAASHTNHPFVLPKPSARRPSLASIFRIGNKHRMPHVAHGDPTVGFPSSSAGPADERRAHSSGTGEDTSSTSEEDWDRMDSASDLDAVAKALSMASDGTATLRGDNQRDRQKGRSPYLQHGSFEPTPPLPLPLPILSAPGSNPGYSMRHSIIPKRSFNVSSSSLRNGDQALQGSPHGSSHMAQRTIRLSNVEEHTDEPNSEARPSVIVVGPAPPASIQSKPHKTGSVRSMPPQFAASGTTSLQDPKLAMTPENIGPLLENAKEVLAKLIDCITEIRALISLTVADSDVQSAPC